ncbi:MAG TPA: DinB family protein [Humisphaera sp.]
MFELILPSYHFALMYTKKLVDGVPDEKWTAQPVPGVTMNHAAWTVGHLAWANDNMLRRLKRTPALDETWRANFAMGTKPLPDRSAYPPAEVLLREFEAAHHRLAEAVAATPPEVFAAAPEEERMRLRFPTIGHLAAGLMSAHYASHNGQLSAWRRAMGFPSAF